MRKAFFVLLIVGVASFVCQNVQAAGLIFAEDGRVGYEENPKQWWSEYVVHDIRRPIPEKVQVDPAKMVFPVAPPDAEVLFDGANLDQWRDTKWKIVDKLLECTEGAIVSKKEYGDFQLHLEYRCPKDFEGPWGNRGNNGVIIFSNVEIQIFDNYSVNTYPDGLCGAVYGQTPPMVNACLPPGTWHAYDIFFRAPRYDADGKETEQARVTIMLNGVMVQDNSPVYGGTGHGTLPSPFNGRKTGTVGFSGHGCPVQFRNVWIRSK